MDTEKKVEIRSIPWTEADITEWENRDWSTLRGIFPRYYTNHLLLVRATVEEVAGALSEIYHADAWEHDVLGREVVIGKYVGRFVFRLRGHSWTEALQCGLDSTEIRSLSRRLNARIIYYSCNRSSDEVKYALYDHGELLEEYSDPADGHYLFYSSIRDVPASGISDEAFFKEHGYFDDYLDEIFKEEDALEPGIRGGYFLDFKKHSPGEKVKILNPGFRYVFPGGRVATSKPEFERVDYLRLSNIIP